MPLSDDISSVLAEVGTPYTVIKPDGTIITGEYLDHITHTEHTTPLIRGFFIDFTLQEPTSAAIGDIVQIDEAVPVKVLMTTKAAELFEGLVIDHMGSGYRVNSTGSLQEFNQDGGYDSNYEKLRPWTDTYTGVDGVLMDQQFRSQMKDIANESFEAELDRLHLYLSDYYTVEPGMRWYISADEYYKVEQIESYHTPGINLIFLAEDTRA